MSKPGITGTASAVQDATLMGIRIEVREDETIEQAIARFRRVLWRHGPPGAGRKRPKWHKRQLSHYLKPSERRRRDALRDEWQTYAGECGRRRLVSEIRRRSKRRKAHFGDLQPCGSYGFRWRPADWAPWFP